MNPENAYALMFTKGTTWTYEQEWRLITGLSKKGQPGDGISVITVPQESGSSFLVTDRRSQEDVDIIVQRLDNPSNRYRLFWIDKLRRGNNPTTLSFVGQLITR